jgi:aminoglycoside 3-N-acetyltransferase
MKKNIKNFIKNKLGIRHPSMYINRYLTDKELKNDKIRYILKYSSIDILNSLKKNGLKRGDTLFIHSSWDKFFNYNGTPKELINIILDFLGEDGTLAMPCFPAIQDHTKIFNLKRTPSGAGFITEIFRRYKNTKRSINLNHSVCAIGKNAEFLTKDHHKSVVSWDEYSPYYRLKEVDAFIVGLGVGHDLKVATSLHCVEAILRDKIYYFSLLFQDEMTYAYKDFEGNMGKHTYIKRKGEIDTKKISKYFNSDELIEFKISNLEIYMIRANILIDKSLELAKDGITMYTKPKPNKDMFYEIF